MPLSLAPAVNAVHVLPYNLITTKLATVMYTLRLPTLGRASSNATGMQLAQIAIVAHITNARAAP